MIIRPTETKGNWTKEQKELASSFLQKRIKEINKEKTSSSNIN